jgi:hypothetical protein
MKSGITRPAMVELSMGHLSVGFASERMRV